MIRASPCDFYLRYLVTHPDNYGDNQIRNLVKLQHLDFLGMEHLGRLRAECAPPAPFYPEDQRHYLSQRFLTKERIYSLYHPDEDALCAITLLDHPRGKEITESMLVTGAEPLWICATLKRVQFSATTRAIELYKHFYFNTDLVDSTELRAILMLRSHISVDTRDEDAKGYSEAYRTAAKADIASLTAASPLSPFARILNMMKLGIMPTGVQIARIATIARMASIVRAAEASLLGHPEKARDFSLAGKILTELMESVGDVSGDLQRSLQGMVLDTDASEVPSMDQLTAGEHTVDLLPEAVPEESDVKA
jgi:hypothetical protein